MPLMLKVTSAMHAHYENLQPTGNLIFCLKITVETSVSVKQPPLLFLFKILV